MKDTIMKIFGELNTAEDAAHLGALPVKQECLYGNLHADTKDSLSMNTRSRMNPVDKDGKLMRCHECDSTRHFANKCPHRNQEQRGFRSRNNRPTEKKQDVNEIHITLFAASPDQRQYCLVGESFGRGVLDSGCTKTVAGEKWMDEYLGTLSESDKNAVVSNSTDSIYRFGDGKEVKATRNLIIPVILGGNKYKLSVDIVEIEIPLLISRSTMKSLSMNKTEKMKKAMKLHRQFAHAGKDKLLKLVKDSNLYDKEFLSCIEECCNDCEICHKYKRPYSRPVVGIPLANTFNQVICMDLKVYEHNKQHILHIIDAATRYSAGCLIKSKHKDVIVSRVFRFWIAYFGSPSTILTDNGGEFSNEVLQEMNEKLNIETKTTAGESPFSNGIVERHNKILAETMFKTIEDTKCEPDVALAWALSAKNSLQNHGGYSPNQLVFGHNVNTPTILTDHLPALEPTTSSEIVRKNLSALHKARENFIKAESSERIKRALRHNVRTYSDETYLNGEKVFYKRKNTKGWKGPGVVLGQDGQMVLVRHGGNFYRVHPSDKNVIDVYDDSEDVEQYHQEQARKVDENDQEDSGTSENEVEENRDTHKNNETEEDKGSGGTSDIFRRPSTESKKVESKPKAKSYIKYNLNGRWYRARVLSAQPKRSGTYKNWVNVSNDGDRKPKSINWNDVSKWVELENPEFPVYMCDVDMFSQEVVDAKERELQNLKENDVFEEVPDTGQTTVSSKWVITEKFKGEKRVVKARLVARGFEENSQSLRTDSPTCGKQSLRLAMAIIVSNDWQINSLDITAAFLQGDAIERELFLQPPKDTLSLGTVWKLKRCLYGLNDASRAWYKRVRSEMLKLGGEMCTYDPAVFYWYRVKQITGIVVCHVDDFVYGGSPAFHKEVIAKLFETFKISTQSSSTFKYLGLDVDQCKSKIKINQVSYIESLITVNIENDVNNERKLTSKEKTMLRLLSGQIAWVAGQTRPDVAYDSCQTSNYGKEPTVQNLKDANKIIRKIKSKHVAITIAKIANMKNCEIICYTDATHASLKCGSSQGAFIIFVKHLSEVIPICWQSKKLQRVTKSPIASETLALSEGADASFYLAKVIQQICKLTKVPKITCIIDNKSLFETLKTTNVTKDLRLRVDIARLRQMVEQDEITVKWVEGKHQLADCLTKHGASPNKLLEVLETSKISLQ
ncbi:uncharacterized protein LOC130642182 [Hydractinia symbiolongicarpus]|uniref:uncharacterized protein LOC130642182 n=1 Tax=Hydractinia symbiolongicarpus TaxID=13093 RepID=UPI00254F362B|nr:uncharacterized protein LOC130642182 [Hydractinia symbiolongicarpus]